MKLFKRFGAALLAVLTLAAMLAGPVAAEPDQAGGIAVQMDGKDLAFTDAVPEITGDRTFLPFRAVLEAMGAQVDFDEATSTVSARKDGVELSMVPGQTTLSVTEDGQTRTEEMDVAPYINPSNDRVYIPVRYAAEAFGYNVGWDEDDRTVILVDMDALLGDATFTLFDKLAAYAKKQATEGNVAITGALGLEATDISGEEPAEPIRVEGSITGIVSKTGVQLTGKVDGADLLYAIIAPMMDGMDDPENAVALKQMLEALSDMLTVELRADLEANTLYFSLPQIMGLIGGNEADSGWRSLDLAPYREQLAGLTDMDQILELKNLGVRDLLQLVMLSLPLSDKDESYAMLEQVSQIYVDLFSDQALTKNGDSYTSKATLMDMVGFEITLAEKGEDITGMDMVMTFTDAESGTELTMTMQSAPDAVGMKMNASATDAESGLKTTFHMEMSCGLTDKVPETGLPDGVVATPFAQK